jgi:proteasome alpha subunit
MEKIFQVDEHIGAVAAGFLADARVLVNQSRVRAQVHKITYEEPADVWNIARVIGDRMQVSTLYAGLRPFGVSFLIAGFDKVGPHVIEADPSGTLFEWQAYALGRGAVLANKILKQRWKANMTEKDAVSLAVDILGKTEKEKKESIIDIAIISSGQNFRKLTKEEINKLK